MATWGCPHEADGLCQKVNQTPCDPGMKGCVLAGRFVFSNPQKNRSRRSDPESTPGSSGDRDPETEK